MSSSSAPVIRSCPDRAGYLATRDPQQQLVQSPLASLADGSRRAELRQPSRGDVVESPPADRKTRRAGVTNGGMTLLRPEDPFPRAHPHHPRTAMLRTPRALAGGFGVVLFNPRGLVPRTAPRNCAPSNGRRPARRGRRQGHCALGRGRGHPPKASRKTTASHSPLGTGWTRTPWRR